MKKNILLPLIGFFIFLQVHGQADTSARYSLNANGESLPVFLKTIQANCQCTFYYNAKDVDSITVRGNFENMTLAKILEQVLPANLRFAIDHRSRVFITRDTRLITYLPPGIYQDNNAQLAERTDSIPEFKLESRKNITVISENKLYEIGQRTNQTTGSIILNGYVRNAQTGEVLVNASVFVDNSIATVTDAYGYFSLTLPRGQHTLNVLALGMKDTRIRLVAYGDGKLDIDIPEQVTSLKEVIVSARKTINVNRVQMGVEKLNIESIKRMPSLFGEADLLRVITTLPGVKTVGEASTGFNVRGGSADQNLILFNDATIYNPSHFFGMFSAFNPEIVKEVELYKSSIPARFGGRLASVLDISSREGNKKNFTGSAGIGVITSRLNIEGPLYKDKTSFIFGGRTTYANWLMNLLPGEYKNSRASFQDLNLGLSHRIDSLSNLYFSGYFSNDRFALNSDTTYGYTNRNANIKWKKTFNNKLTGVFIAGLDRYQYNVISDSNEVNAFKLNFGISQVHAKADFVYYKNQQHGFDFGVSSQLYKLAPGALTPVDSKSLVTPDIVDDEQALESGIYLTHRYNPTNKLSVSSGIRYSMFNYLGPQSVDYYAPGLPITEANRTSTVEHGKDDFIQNYHGPELRFSLRYAFTPSFSIKAGYNSQRQYLHMLSNTTAIAPTDIWKLSDPNIKPQLGDQVSLGFYKNLKANTIETSVEVYYKRIKDYLDYKPGATLLLNQQIEQDVINTRGKAYGMELLIKKPGGKLNGWISYTYSRILLQSNDPDLGVLVNNGDFYPANYDKPHDVTLSGNFRVNHRFSFSINSTYSTGRPITYPIGRYYYAGSVRVLYSDRNEYRIPDYMRTDFSMNIEGNHKVNQKTHNSWTLGVYNMLGRRNPYSIYFTSQEGRVKGYKMSIFGSAIPFINFNIRF